MGNILLTTLRLGSKFQELVDAVTSPCKKPAKYARPQAQVFMTPTQLQETRKKDLNHSIRHSIRDQYSGN